MAFKQSRSLRSQLNVNGTIDSERSNPRNLDGITLPSGVVISGNYTQFNQASADARIDRLTELQEAYVQGKRVADEETKTLKKYAELMKSLKKLAEQCYETEKAAAEAEVQIRTLSHQLKILKKTLASQHAADVEEANIGFADYERNLSQRLRDRTNTAASGTNYGASYRGAHAGARVAVLN